MPNTPHPDPDRQVFERCANGAACSEVVDRLLAADRIEYLDHDKACADQLRATAARFADLHQHGAPVRQARYAAEEGPA